MPNHQVAWRKPAAHGELLWGRPWRRAKGKHAKGNQNRFCANSRSEVRCRALVTFWYAVLVATTSCDSFWPTHPGSGQKNNHEHGVYMEYIYIYMCMCCMRKPLYSTTKGFGRKHGVPLQFVSLSNGKSLCPDLGFRFCHQRDVAPFLKVRRFVDPQVSFWFSCITTRKAFPHKRPTHMGLS